MGWHDCEYSHHRSNRYPTTSSGDVTLTFDSGRSWEMPDMVLHYVADHNWLPPQPLVDDVMNHQLIAGDRRQTRSVSVPTPVGYLHGPFPTGTVPDGFIERLESLMDQADHSGGRLQSKSSVLR